MSRPTPTPPRRASHRWPHRNVMRERLGSAEGKALYKLRKQTVEPVFGQPRGPRLPPVPQARPRSGERGVGTALYRAQPAQAR